MMGQRMFLRAFAVLLLVTVYSNFSLAESFDQNPCLDKKTCGDCIQTKQCAWCWQPDYYDKPRCSLPDLNNVCQKEYLWSPDNMEMILQAEQLSQREDARASESAKLVQLYPQRVNLILRPSEFFDTKKLIQKMINLFICHFNR